MSTSLPISPSATPHPAAPAAIAAVLPGAAPAVPVPATGVVGWLQHATRTVGAWLHRGAAHVVDGAGRLYRWAGDHVGRTLHLPATWDRHYVGGATVLLLVLLALVAYVATRGAR